MTQTRLGPELETLIRFLTHEQGYSLKALGDGIICLSASRLYSDGNIECIISFDPNKWRMKGAERCQGIISINCRYISGDPKENLGRPTAMQQIRAMLEPRSDDVKFFDETMLVEIKDVVGEIHTPSLV